jgi:hypothetical protein
MFLQDVDDRQLRAVVVREFRCPLESGLIVKVGMDMHEDVLEPLHGVPPGATIVDRRHPK